MTSDRLRSSEHICVEKEVQKYQVRLLIQISESGPAHTGFCGPVSYWKQVRLSGDDSHSYHTH